MSERYFYEFYAGSPEDSHREILWTEAFISTQDWRALTTAALLRAAQERRDADVAYWTPHRDTPEHAQHARRILSGHKQTIQVAQIFHEAIEILIRQHGLQRLPIVAVASYGAWDTVWPKPETFAGDKDWTLPRAESDAR